MEHPTRMKVLAVYRDDPLATCREIAKKVGISIGNVSNHLKRLEREGLVIRRMATRDTYRQASKPGAASQRWARINHSVGEKRSSDGRKGKGVDAFTAKVTDDWGVIMKRIEKIAERNQVNGQTGSAAKVSDPIHARHECLKAEKF